MRSALRHRFHEIVGFFNFAGEPLRTIVVESCLTDIGGGEDHVGIDDKQFYFAVACGWYDGIEGTVHIKAGSGFQISNLRKTTGPRRLPIVVAQRYVCLVVSRRFHQVSERILQDILEAFAVIDTVCTQRCTGRIDIVPDQHAEVAPLLCAAILLNRGRYQVHARCGNYTPRDRRDFETAEVDTLVEVACPRASPPIQRRDTVLR